MREYYVYFSFYSEEFGNFDDVHYMIKAENPFEARSTAWLLCAEDEETKLRNNLKQIGVSWRPNLLDMNDYFQFQAADIKRELNRIKYVSVPNDRLNKKERENREWREREKFGCYSSMQTINAIAKDLFADKGMAPPSIFEELHYAEKLCEKLKPEQGFALWNKMEKAKKWDYIAISDLQSLFRNCHEITCNISKKGV